MTRIPTASEESFLFYKEGEEETGVRLNFTPDYTFTIQSVSIDSDSTNIDKAVISTDTALILNITKKWLMSPKYAKEILHKISKHLSSEFRKFTIIFTDIEVVWDIHHAENHKPPRNHGMLQTRLINTIKMAGVDLVIYYSQDMVHPIVYGNDTIDHFFLTVDHSHFSPRLKASSHITQDCILAACVGRENLVSVFIDREEVGKGYTPRIQSIL